MHEDTLQKLLNNIKNGSISVEQAIKEIKPWTYQETLKYYEFLKKDIISKGGKIYQITAEEKTRYLKDAYDLYPEVRKIAGSMGNQFVDILESYRDK